MKNRKKSFIPKAKFDMDNAKIYIIAALIIFHILPLIFVFMGESGQSVLTNMFMFTVNPMMIFGVAFFYGVRLGFEWKFPLILAVISSASIFMYYDFADVNYLILSSMLCLIVYTLFSFVFALAGALVKKMIGGE